jgi:hypothetical protein
MVRLSVAQMLVAAAVASGVAGMLADTARADAIDGEWCLGSSHFSIEGPNITTPGGNRIQGNYSRHGFDYVVPANEPGAGGRIDMVLLNEETVQLIRAGAAGAPEIWRRCRPTS